MQTAIVILIVVIAAVYVGRVFYKGFRQKDACSCGCTCCSITDSCTEPLAGAARDASQTPSDH